MYGSGHIFEMINRIKSNEAQKRSRKDKRQKIRDAYADGSHHIELNDSNKLKPEELAALKQRIRRELIREKRIENAKVFTVSVLLIAGIFGLLWYAKMVLWS